MIDVNAPGPKIINRSNNLFASRITTSGECVKYMFVGKTECHGGMFEMIDEFFYFWSLLNADNTGKQNKSIWMQRLVGPRRRVHRTIFGDVQKNGLWRRMMNLVLALIYGDSRI